MSPGKRPAGARSRASLSGSSSRISSSSSYPRRLWGSFPGPSRNDITRSGSPLAEWLAAHVLHLDQKPTLEEASVSNLPFGWVLFLCYVVIAIAAAALWSILDRNRGLRAALFLVEVPAALRAGADDDSVRSDQGDPLPDDLSSTDRVAGRPDRRPVSESPALVDGRRVHALRNVYRLAELVGGVLLLLPGRHCRAP